MGLKLQQKRFEHDLVRKEGLGLLVVFPVFFFFWLINLAKTTPKMTNARDKETYTKLVNGGMRNKATAGS